MQQVVDPKGNPAVAGSAPAVITGNLLVWADKDQALWWTLSEANPGSGGNFTWQPFAKVGGQSSASPSLGFGFAGVQNLLIPSIAYWAAWKGAGDDNGIYVAQFPDGPGNPEPLPAFSGIGTSATPALCFWPGGLLMAFKGESDNTLYYTLYAEGGQGAFLVFDWSAGTGLGLSAPIPGAFSSHAPAVAAALVGSAPHSDVQKPGIVYIVYKDPEDTTLWMTQFTYSEAGIYWVPPVLLPDNIRSDREPGLCVTSSGVLWMAFKGESDNAVWVANFNGTTWSQPVQIPGIGTSGRPALTPIPGIGVALAIIGESTGHLYFGMPAALQGL